MQIFRFCFGNPPHDGLFMKKCLSIIVPVLSMAVWPGISQALDAWETAFGIDLANPSKATADWDRDGLTSQQEHDAGTNPWGVWRAVCISDQLGAGFSTSYGLTVSPDGLVFGSGYYSVAPGSLPPQSTVWCWQEAASPGGAPSILLGPANASIIDVSSTGVAVGCQSVGYNTWVGFRWAPASADRPLQFIPAGEVIQKINAAGDTISWKAGEGPTVRFADPVRNLSPTPFHTGSHSPAFSAVDINEFSEILGTRYLPEYDTYTAVLYYRGQLIHTGLPSLVAGNPFEQLSYYWS